jgi:arginine:agmatine antiporter
MHGTAGGKKMGLVAATSLVVANMVGTGLFLLPSSLAAVGSISVFGWIVSALGATALGLVFVRLSAVAPKIRRPVRVSARCRRPLRGLPDHLLYWGASVWETWRSPSRSPATWRFFLRGLEQPLAACLCTIAVLWLFVWLNTRGASSVGKFTTITTVAGILPVAVVGALGWFWFDRGVFDAGWNPLGHADGERRDDQRIDRVVGVPRRGERGCVGGADREPQAQRAAGDDHRAGGRDRDLHQLLHRDHGHPAQRRAEVLACAVRRRRGPDAWRVGGNVIAIAAILKAAGSLVGWILIAAQSSQAASADGLFAPGFSKLNANGMPARNLVLTGILMTVLVVLTASPTISEQFSRITNATVILMAIPTSTRWWRCGGWIVARSASIIAQRRSRSAPPRACIASVLPSGNRRTWCSRR